MVKVVLPGGTGYLGLSLGDLLVERGDEVVVLTRGQAREQAGRRFVTWTGDSLGAWVEELADADAIVNLTGQRVDVRATKANVDELIRSRVEPVKALGQAIRQLKSPPPVWIQTSSLAIYGEGGDEEIREGFVPSGIGPREMVTVCLAWEHAFGIASEPADRTVLLRPGIGFGGATDPATAKLTQLTKLGLGGTVGSGNQWVSWIDLRDMLAIFLRSIDDEQMRGMYHVTAPNPVTNRQMMAGFRAILKPRFALPSPALLAKVGAPLLGSSASLALTGRRVLPERLLNEGFEFQHPDFEASLRHVLSA